MPVAVGFDIHPCPDGLILALDGLFRHWRDQGEAGFDTGAEEWERGAGDAIEEEDDYAAAEDRPVTPPGLRCRRPCCRWEEEEEPVVRPQEWGDPPLEEEEAPPAASTPPPCWSPRRPPPWAASRAASPPRAPWEQACQRDEGEAEAEQALPPHRRRPPDRRPR